MTTCINPRASLGPRVLAQLHPSQISLAWAGGESPPLSGRFQPGIVIFDTTSM